MVQVKSIFIDKYQITYTEEYLQIGRQRHKLKDWQGFDDARILEMDGKGALKWWRENKDFILSTIGRFPAVNTGKEK